MFLNTQGKKKKKTHEKIQIYIVCDFNDNSNSLFFMNQTTMFNPQKTREDIPAVSSLILGSKIIIVLTIIRYQITYA